MAKSKGLSLIRMPPKTMLNAVLCYASSKGFQLQQ
jgi:hypothetical protein